MYFFIHNPKTAGTSLIGVLRKQIYFHRFLRLTSTRGQHPRDFMDQVPRLVGAIPDRQLASIQVIGGHFAYGAHEGRVQAPQYFTVMRSPVERVVSEYYFMKQFGFYHQKDIDGENLQLADYLTHPATRYLNNLQTRLISGVPYSQGEEVNEAMYQQALVNLKGMTAVGITERFSDSLALMYERLEWPRLPTGITTNVNPHRPRTSDHTPNTLESVAQRERWDIALYEEANRLFNQHWGESPEHFAALSRQISNPSSYAGPG